jgi:DNA polymerase-1
VATEIEKYFGFESRVVAHDTEGTGLVPYGPVSYWGYAPARPFAFAYCDATGRTAYVRYTVDPYTRKPLIENDEDWDHIVALHASEEFIKVGHNIGYDMRMDRMVGAPILGDIHDTMILAHVITGGDELMYGLKPLAKKYLDYPDDDEKILEAAVNMARRAAKAQGFLIAGGKKEVERGDHVVFAGSKPAKADYWLGPEEMCEEYAVGDVRRTMLMFLLWFERLMRDQRGAVTYAREMQLFRALRRMEDRGTRVDPVHAAKLVKWYNAYAARMRRWADANGAEGVNFRSPKQLCRIFYDERGLEPAYTKKGHEKIELARAMGEEPDWEALKKHRSLGKDQLAEWGGKDELTDTYKDEMAKAILEWRAAKQSISSFLNIYEKFWYPEGPVYQTEENLAEYNRRLTLSPQEKVEWEKDEWVFVLHPNYNQTGAVTGRMTCSDPNLQQVASATTGLRKADIPSRPRECFGPRPGCIWYLPDYSQVEVWLFAFLSGEPNMKGLLLSGHDFHSGVASKTFTSRPDYEERSKYYRKLAKLIMFGKLYGGGVGSREKPGRMTKLLQMPFDEAKEFIESFDEEFAQATAFMKRMAKDAKRTGEAFNIFGRRYVLGPDWAYKVVNYLIQGAAADILKNATIRLDWMLQTRWEILDPRCRMINSIHDEFMVEVPYTVHSRRLMYEIIYTMQMDSALAGLPVPLPIGIKTAKKRWSHTTDVDIPDWVKGGVPRGPEGTRYFRDLERHMQDCPYTESYAGAQAQFARTRAALDLRDAEREPEPDRAAPRRNRRRTAA